MEANGDGEQQSGGGSGLRRGLGSRTVARDQGLGVRILYHKYHADVLKHFFPFIPPTPPSYPRLCIR